MAKAKSGKSGRKSGNKGKKPNDTKKPTKRESRIKARAVWANAKSQYAATIVDEVPHTRITRLMDEFQSIINRRGLWENFLEVFAALASLDDDKDAPITFLFSLFTQDRTAAELVDQIQNAGMLDTLEEE